MSLEQQSAASTEPQTLVEQGADGPPIDWQWCIACGARADMVRVAIGYCARMESIRYGICKACKGTKKAEDEIVAAQQRAFIFCKPPSDSESQILCDEAVAFGVADGLISFAPVPQSKRAKKFKK
jgi:hypothetical protein